MNGKIHKSTQFSSANFPSPQKNYICIGSELTLKAVGKFQYQNIKIYHKEIKKCQCAVATIVLEMTNRIIIIELGMYSLHKLRT